jgi:amicyanin
MCIRNELRSLVIAAALGAVSAAGMAPTVVRATAQKAEAISIDNFTFNPPTLRVMAGTTVTWTNKDDIPHGIASSSSAFARSQALDTNDKFSFTFTKPGTYQYFCYIHPHMVGSVVVEGAAGGNATR